MIALDGAWPEQGTELVFQGLGPLKTSEVGEVLERTLQRMERHLRRRGLLRTLEDDASSSGEGDGESKIGRAHV